MQIRIFKLINSYKLKAHFSFDYLKSGITMMIPSTISQSVYSFGSFFLQILVNGYGVEIINGYNVAFTLNNLLLCPLVGICNAYESFCAQNIGANKHDRVDAGFKSILFFGTLVCIISSLLTLIFNLTIYNRVVDKFSIYGCILNHQVINASLSLMIFPIYLVVS